MPDIFRIHVISRRDERLTTISGKYEDVFFAIDAETPKDIVHHKDKIAELIKKARRDSVVIEVTEKGPKQSRIHPTSKEDLYSKYSDQVKSVIESLGYSILDVDFFKEGRTTLAFVSLKGDVDLEAIYIFFAPRVVRRTTTLYCHPLSFIFCLLLL